MCVVTVTGGEFTGYYGFLKGFYGLADIPNIFQERIDKTLEFKHPAWLDDITIVTKVSAERHETEMKETIRKLKEAVYRLNPKKCEFFKKEAEWIGYKKSKWNTTPRKQNRSENKNRYQKTKKN